jgi:predicted signal transduction protein with EAL and GGDEF domain
VGDDVLRAMASRLRAEVPAPGLCARLGGDEFAVLLPVGDRDAALRAAHAIGAALRRRLPLSGRDVVLDCSIGVVVAADDRAQGTPDELLRDADLAMYAAKRAGGGRAELFVPDMHARAVARLELEAELRRGLDRGEVVPHYQPVVELGTGRVVGLEALARWQHPERGLLSPASFIALAEESDLIVVLGHQLLTRACTEVAAWLRRHPHEAFSLNVNVSARQLRDPTFVRRVEAVLAATGLPARHLTLEITESVVMDDPEGCRERLEALVSLGVAMAVDDFGTGYSSLGYLQRLPIRTLKIDRSFVAPLEHDPDARVLTGAVLRLAETLSLHVTAEGVETPAQADALVALGCTTAQGYLFGRPGPLAELPEPVGVVAA